MKQRLHAGQLVEEEDYREGSREQLQALAATKEFSIGSVLAAALIRTSCKKNSTRIALNLFFAENVFLFNSGRPWQEMT